MSTSTPSIYDPPDPETVRCVIETITANANGKSEDSEEYKLYKQITNNPKTVDFIVDRGAGHGSKVQATCSEAVNLLNKGHENWLYMAGNSLWPNTNMTPPPPKTSSSMPSYQMGGRFKKSKKSKKEKKSKKSKKNLTKKKRLKIKTFKKYKKKKL